MHHCGAWVHKPALTDTQKKLNAIWFCAVYVQRTYALYLLQRTQGVMPLMLAALFSQQPCCCRRQERCSLHNKAPAAEALAKLLGKACHCLVCHQIMLLALNTAQQGVVL